MTKVHRRSTDSAEHFVHFDSDQGGPGAWGIIEVSHFKFQLRVPAGQCCDDMRNRSQREHCIAR